MEIISTPNRKKARAAERLAYGLSEFAAMLGISESMARLERCPNR
jgi:hypothetical protein